MKLQVLLETRLEKWKGQVDQHGHLLNPLLFVGGFLFDVITLGRIDELFNLVTLILYQFISLVVFFVDDLTFSYSATNRTIRWVKNSYLSYRDEVFHFSQGAVLSAFTLFYFKSAALSSNFFFMMVITLILLLNEMSFIQKNGHFIKMLFLNLTTLSFFIVFMPIIWGKIHFWVFFTSLVVFLICSYLVKNKLPLTSEEEKKYSQHWWKTSLILVIIFLFLRSLKLIPPVPLCLEEAAIYHRVEKDYPRYKLYYEKPWWRFWHHSDESFTAYQGEQVYFFTRIFAPSGFQDKIYVRWQFEGPNGYETTDRIPLTILGGRDQGYRGYTTKQNYKEGQWRVVVETQDGLEIGRLSFSLEIINEKRPESLPLKMREDS